LNNSNATTSCTTTPWRRAVPPVMHQAEEQPAPERRLGRSLVLVERESCAGRQRRFGQRAHRWPPGASRPTGCPLRSRSAHSAPAVHGFPTSATMPSPEREVKGGRRLVRRAPGTCATMGAAGHRGPGDPGGWKGADRREIAGADWRPGIRIDSQWS
jgi:hypothetical protein